MMYFPLKFRVQTEPCVPKAIGISRFKEIEILFDGNKVNLHMPKHQGASYHNEVKHRAKYDSEKMQWENLVGATTDWQYINILSRGWQFYGPMFTGAVAGLEVSLGVIKPGDKPVGVSFFHPRAFEDAIGKILQVEYFDETAKRQNRQQWLAPCNWNPKKASASLAVVFDVCPAPDFNAGELRKNLLFPIDDDKIFSLMFSMSRNTNFSTDPKYKDLEPDQWIDKAPMIDLMENIINSVEVNHSNTVDEKISKQIKMCENYSLVDEYPPLKWAF